MRSKGMIGATLLGIILVIGLIMTITCIEKVPVGYDAIIYSINGGVQDEILTQGWHILSPTKKAKLFAIANDQLLLTKDSREGSEADESFKVATSDNATINISFQMSYRFMEDRIVDTYKSYKMDGESIVNNRVRTVLKSRVSEVCTNYSLMDLYSGNRAAINSEITEYLNDNFSKQFGIEIIDASIIDVHPNDQLQEAIDNRIKAQQKADQAKAEQETAKVEAETALIKAKNKADIVRTEAQAEADANKTISASITDELIRMKEAEARLQHGWITVQGAGAVVTNGTTTSGNGN